MRFILAFIVCCFMASSIVGQEPNPRLKNFRYGTGKASWWGTPQMQAPLQSRSRPFYYSPPIRYYQPMYYRGHFSWCNCNICTQRMMMYQQQLNRQRFFFFQFRF